MGDVIVNEREAEGEQSSDNGCKDDALEVYERRIADNASVGMEKAKGDGIENRGERCPYNYGPEGFGETYVVKLIVFAYETCKQYNKTVQKENTPIWECLVGKVPVGEFGEEFHGLGGVRGERITIIV